MSEYFFPYEIVRKTRKDHTCEACGRSIAAGNAMYKQTYIDGDNAYSFYWCAICDDVRDAIGADWTEGVRNTHEDIEDNINLICPYFDIDEPNSAMCDGVPDNHFININTRRIECSCHCYNRKVRIWDVDILQAIARNKETCTK